MSAVLVEITERQLDPEKIAARIHSAECGAQNIFIGSTRSHNKGKEVSAITYDAHAALAEKIMAAKNRTLTDCDLSTQGPRAKDGGVRFQCVRSGGVVGLHEIIFASDYEVVTLKHEALSRDVFARGAL